VTPPDLSRRKLLGAGAAVGALAATGGALTRADAATKTQRLQELPVTPEASGLDHIVVVCMENRSFDHYFGWVKGADGKQAGLSYKDDHGKVHHTHHLQTRQGCGMADPDHSYEGGRVQLAGGKLDGFRKGKNDDLAIGYYTEADLPLFGPLLKQAATFDRFFCSILGPTYPNRIYTHAAATDRTANSITPFSKLPTIWDQLVATGVTSRYYFSDLPILGLWGPKYIELASPIAQFHLDAAAGLLPQYSYLDPSFIGEGQGGSNDDHPHADIHRGQAFLSQIVHSVVNSPQWDRTALVITYDEWGGFFDHVKPPSLPDSYGDGPGSKNDHNQVGFRIPTVVLSPFARRNWVGHNVYTHASILKMVEWRFGLKPMTKRDAAARNLAETFVWDKPDYSRPSLPVVPDPGRHDCAGAPLLESPFANPNAMGLEDPMWREMADSEEFMRGWRNVLS
jgi:phospholipase C